MKKFNLLILVALLLSIAVVPVLAQDEVTELRITWYDDGNEGAVLRDLLDQFEAENTDIRVVMDTVAYNVVLEQLPIQVEAGEAPDMGRITDLPRMAGQYLDLRPYIEDPAYWEENFPADVFNSLRAGADDEGIYGFPTQFTVTGPFINRTLFEQAGIEVPSDTSDAVTWEEWTEVAVQVAEATGTEFAIAMDRSGHRFAGPAISQGAIYFDEDGEVVIDTEGFRDMADILISWHADAITPAEVWVGAGGSYAAAADFFINGQLVVYMAGSWQVARFSNDIADAFDWEAVPNPSGPGGSTGMPGGAALVAFETEAGAANPERYAAVGRVMDFLAREDIQREFAARTLFIPGHLNLGEVPYETDLPAAQQALATFTAEIPKFDTQAYLLQYSPIVFAINNPVRDRLTQVITGELTLDQAIERIEQDVADAIAAEGA
ncbi:MAG: carbohydrate ABC transporter substrate-binding protein [Chloroflexi bacterium]|nr:carbohydrate ABC transporter substrate-binding protein [Chloroflexota bacterium]